MSRSKHKAQTIGNTTQGSELPPLPIVHDNVEFELDSVEVNSTTNVGSDKAAGAGATGKIIPLGGNPDSGIEAGHVKLSGLNDLIRPLLIMLFPLTSWYLDLRKSIY